MSVSDGGQGLRVALLGTRGIPAAYGGFETFAEQLSIRLVQHGYSVTVYAEADEECIPEDSTYQGVTIRYRRRPSWGPGSVVAYDCACLWDARRNFDVVYMLGYGAAWACWLPRLWGTPVWINVDGLEWKRSKWSLLARLYLRVMEAVATRTATHLIADAEAIALRFRLKYPGGAKCTTIAYGADVVCVEQVNSDDLSQWGLRSGQYTLVVARPEPENHLLEIIEGYPQHAPNWPLVIVGDVGGVNNYQRSLLALKSDRIRFLGGIYDASKLTSLRVHAAIYVHGHSVGGTNPSLLEAMACGNLIVAHDNQFNREVVGEAAWYFKNSSELAEAIQFLSTAKAEHLKKLRYQVQERVRARYSWDQIAQQYMRQFENIR